MGTKEIHGARLYVCRWLDGLPGATASYTNEVSTRAYRVGFPLGQIKVYRICALTTCRLKKRA